MHLEDLLNELDEMVTSAMALPMTNGKCVIGREKAKELIEDLRTNLPKEVQQAKAVVEERNDIVAKAKEEAAEIIEKAQQQADALVEESEITKLATEKATEMLTLAQAKAKELKQAASDYAEEVLTGMEETLAKSLQEVHATSEHIRNL